MSELPVPNLGELSDLRTLRHVVRKVRSPNALSYSYADLCDLDTVIVALVPEKKGLILKHVEYEVASQVDFVQVCFTQWILYCAVVHFVVTAIRCNMFNC